jgi:hypothetical protein
MLSLIKKLLPSPIKRRIFEYLKRRTHDEAKARLFGNLAPLVPAVAQMFDGPPSLEEFKSNGDEFLQLYTKTYGLGPEGARSLVNENAVLGRGSDDSMRLVVAFL